MLNSAVLKPRRVRTSHTAERGPESGHVPNQIWLTMRYLRLRTDYFCGLNTREHYFSLINLRFRGAVFGMVFTGRRQGEHLFTAPGFQVIRFAGLSLVAIRAVNPKGSAPIPELFPPFASEIRTREIDTTIGLGAS
jgi:hypothetical protein